MRYLLLFQVKRFLSKIPYKYIIVTASFAVFMLFMDQNDWITQYTRKTELEETKSHTEFLKSEIAKMSQELDRLQSDKEYVVQQSRNKYLHKRADEDVFIITKDTMYITAE